MFAMAVKMSRTWQGVPACGSGCLGTSSNLWLPCAVEVACDVWKGVSHDEVQSTCPLRSHCVSVSGDSLPRQDHVVRFNEMAEEAAMNKADIVAEAAFVRHQTRCGEHLK